MDQDTFYPHAHEGLTLLAFLTALNTQVQDLTRDDLIARLVKYAETIPAEERMAFLRLFTSSAQPEEKHRHIKPDPSLLDDVPEFAAKVRSEAYVEDCDWDYSDNIIVTGDTSWAGDMADLFSRTDAAFFAADFATAATAYASLLTLLHKSSSCTLKRSCSPNKVMMSALFRVLCWGNIRAIPRFMLPCGRNGVRHPS
jgi:hypothetical protein